MTTTNIYDMADTWSVAGTAFDGIKMNVTDTASAAASTLINLLVGGTTKFKVQKDGQVFMPGDGSSAFLDIPGSGTGLVLRAGASNAARFTTSGASVRDALSIVGSGLTIDCTAVRDAAADAWAHRRGVNAQTWRVYRTYTDASNYERLAIVPATGNHAITAEAAGTGSANIDLSLVPKGTGAVRFGTHSALAAETVTGYITIKDAGGTSRKVAVVS